MSTTTIDWPTLISDMQWLLGEAMPGTVERQPCGTLLVAQHLGISRGAVRNWLAGTEPAYTHGEAALLAWAALSGKPVSAAPRAKVVERERRTASYYA